MISVFSTDEQEAIVRAKQLIHISPMQAPKLLEGLIEDYRKRNQVACALQVRRYQCYAHMNNLAYEKARASLEKLFAEASDAGELRFIGIGEMYLGIIATEHGEVTSAAECFDHAIRIGIELCDLDLIFRVQVNLGYAQLMMQRYEDALKTCRLAIQQFEGGNIDQNAAVAHMNIAHACVCLAFEAKLRGEVPDDLLLQAKKSLNLAKIACKDDFRLDSQVQILDALYCGIVKSPKAGLEELARTKESVFQRAAVSVSLIYLTIEANLYELDNDWTKLKRTTTRLRKHMREYRCLANFQVVSRQAAKAHAMLGDHKSAYAVLVESSDYLRLVSSTTGLNGAHISALRFDLEQRAFDEVVLRMRNKSLAEQNRILEQESRLDLLSGTLNRRGIEESLNEYVRGMHVQKIAIALIDIDLFKRVNDKFGHARGDQVIRQFGQLLLNSSSLPSKVGRWGGEEFLMIFDVSSGIEVSELGEMLMDEIRSHPWNDIAPDLVVTASCGIALWQKGDSLDEKTELADRMLYAVKQSGRNGWKAANFGHAA